MTSDEATAATNTARTLGRPCSPLKLPSRAKKTPAMGALKPAAKPAATPAATRAFWAWGDRLPRRATQRPIFPPLSTLGPSGPREAPLPKLTDAPSSRWKGSLGLAVTAPSAIAIRLGRPGPRSPEKRRIRPTTKPPRVGTTTTGQRLSQSGSREVGSGGGSGAAGGGGR